MNTRSFFKWGGMFQGGETDWQSIWVGSIPIFSTVVKAWIIYNEDYGNNYKTPNGRKRNYISKFFEIG